MPSIDAAIGEGHVYSVSEITSRIKTLIEGRFPDVWIVGEVSNCTHHSSGHTYFTLKDEHAQIRCVLFAGSARRITLKLQDGLKVYAQGRVAVYERQGQHQLIISNLLPLGRGELYIAFEALKEKLEKEGLFEEERKLVLPEFPARLAVVTSPTGAAVRDVIKSATRIHAGVEIVVYPVRVQGQGAREEIAEAIRDLNRMELEDLGRSGSGEGAPVFDVIILARGGGSIEDLWAFNEEVVARAIADSRIPVVSGVGHEIDFTIADFVADVRAPTPTAAPVVALEGYVDLAVRLEALRERAGSALSGRLERHAGYLESLKSHYGLRGLRDRVASSMQELDEALARARRSVESAVDGGAARLATLKAGMAALSPMATLDRGYSICFREGTPEIIKDVRQVDTGDRLRIRFSRGSATSTIDARDDPAEEDGPDE
jgi:exodeoxyribonuclease VII large subunit